MSGQAAGGEGAAPSLPPLLYAVEAAAGGDPVERAVADARAGVDAGAVTWVADATALRAAITLAPEEPLEDALAMVLVAQNALADALGALAPSETAAQWAWPDRLLVNGAEAGRLTAASDASDPAALPNWLVIGVEVAFAPGLDAGEPGEARERTTLWEEGCGDITPKALLESWSRHLLVWMHRWRDEGMRAVAETWRARAAEAPTHSPGFDVKGRFLGLDDKGGALIEAAEGVVAVPLSRWLAAAQRRSVAG